MNSSSFIRLILVILASTLAACGKSSGTETPNPKNNDTIDGNQGGTTSTLKVLATDDTNTKQLYPNEIKGSSEKIDVWNYENQDKQAFIYFDTSAFAGSRVKRAVLRLWVYEILNPGKIHFFRVTGQWEEMSLTYNSLNLLALNYLFPLQVYASDRHNYVDVDITALVQAWSDGSIPNDGLSIVADQAAPIRIDFHSKDAITNPSYLEVTIE